MAAARVAFIHASPAAIQPLANYYASQEPGWRTVHLLDDGIMRSFREGNEEEAESGLLSLIQRAAERYQCQAALITCSATTLGLMKRLGRASPVPAVKIDQPMAEAAVAAGSRIGVLVTFAPTVEPTKALLAETAQEMGRRVSTVVELCPEALDALLKGDVATHDGLLRAAAERLAAQAVNAIVLAQVSMAHLRQELSGALGLPVYSSLETSHAALREALGL